MSDSRSYDVRLKKSASIFFGSTGVSKHAFTLPPYSIILSFMVEVLTAFNDSGTDLVQIGDDSSATFYADAVDVSTTGEIIVEQSNLGLTSQRTAKEIFVKYTGQNADATTGELRLNVLYASPYES